MSISIYYKAQPLLEASAASMDDLAEKLLSVSNKNLINPTSNLIQLIKKITAGYSSHIELDLDSKQEVLKLAELISLAINEWKCENFYKNYEYIENGKIINPKLDRYRELVKKLKQIAAHEWKDENLFIHRAYTIEDLAPTLYFFAQQKGYNLNSHLIKLLQKLLKKEVKDIEIYSKKDLDQFIGLMELSIQKLISEGYFEQYNFTENGTIFNYVQSNYLNYIKRLKEVAADWDNAVSDEWKQDKLLTKPQPKVKYEIQPTVDPSYTTESLLKEIIKLVGHTFLLIAIILVAIWLLTLIAKTYKAILNFIKY